MRVFTDANELLGKKVFKDPRLEKVKEKSKSAKATFLSIEFTNENIDSCDCLLVSKDKLFDIIVDDIAKAEAAVAKSPDNEIIKKALDALNSEKPLSQALSKDELDSIKEYAFITAKPIIHHQGTITEAPFLDIFKAMSLSVFFTANPKESRAWLLPKQSDVVTAAAKIHTDLAKGFIRAEVYNVGDLDSFHSLEEAKQKRILKVVDRDYVVQDADIINIKFNIRK